MEEDMNQYRPEAVRPPPEGGPAAEHSFDELAKGLANRSLSRGDALKWVGAAIVGGLLASIPGVAWASHKPSHAPPGQSPPPPPPPPECPSTQVCGSACCQSGESCVNGTCLSPESPPPPPPPESPPPPPPPECPSTQQVCGSASVGYTCCPPGNDCTGSDDFGWYCCYHCDNESWLCCDWVGGGH
jgi:hypothetical protein